MRGRLFILGGNQGKTPVDICKHPLGPMTRLKGGCIHPRVDDNLGDARLIDMPDHIGP